MVCVQVLEGMAVVDQILNLETDTNDKPLVDVVVADSGLLPVNKPFELDGM